MKAVLLDRITDIDIAVQQPYFLINNGYIGLEVKAGSVTGDVTLLQSFSGTDPETAASNWQVATDTNGDDIVGTIANGKVLFNVCGVAPGSYFALKFSASAGDVTIYNKAE